MTQEEKLAAALESLFGDGSAAIDEAAFSLVPWPFREIPESVDDLLDSGTIIRAQEFATDPEFYLSELPDGDPSRPWLERLRVQTVIQGAASSSGSATQTATAAAAADEEPTAPPATSPVKRVVTKPADATRVSRHLAGVEAAIEAARRGGPSANAEKDYAVPVETRPHDSGRTAAGQRIKVIGVDDAGASKDDGHGHDHGHKKPAPAVPSDPNMGWKWFLALAAGTAILILSCAGGIKMIIGS